METKSGDRDIYYVKFYGTGLGGNKKQELGKQNKKRERKKEENYTKKGGKGLKNASFWVKKAAGGGSSNPSPCRKLIHRGKK